MAAEVFCYVFDSTFTDCVGLAQVKNFDSLGHAQAHRIPFWTRFAWCFAPACGRPTGNLAEGSASSCARRRDNARPAGRLHAGAGNAALRQRLRRFVYVACRQWALAARLCCRRCLVSFARFSMSSGYSYRSVAERRRACSGCP